MEQLLFGVESWREWDGKGCDFFGYAWGTPPDFRPHPRYAADIQIVRQAFQTMNELERMQR